MANLAGATPGEISIAEIQEFASFQAGTQRYIRRSLDIGLRRHDAEERWSRNVMEESSIRAQSRLYERLDLIRTHMLDESGVEALGRVMAPLIAISAFDLAQGRIEDFGSYRFLYERLLGAHARPWLPAAYCAAACLPHLHPDRRRILLTSVDERVVAAASWSGKEPSFYPQWVDKIDDEAQSAT